MTIKASHAAPHIYTTAKKYHSHDAPEPRICLSQQKEGGVKKLAANRIAIALAMSATLGVQPEFKSPLPPKEKTQNDFDRLAKAEEKRTRKAQKRIKASHK